MRRRLTIRLLSLLLTAVTVLTLIPGTVGYASVLPPTIAVSAPEDGVAQSVAPGITITIALGEHGTALFFLRGVMISEADLLEGVSGADETGAPVPVEIIGVEDLDLQNPQMRNEGYPNPPYIVTYAATHPLTGEEFTATRECYVTTGESEVQAASGGWDGADTDISWYNASDDSFTINTEAQLAGLASLVNKGNTFSGKTITLGGNLDLSGEEWTPIASANTRPFSGTFDGGGHTITGLTVTSNAAYKGMFGYCRGATIENLTLENVTITGANYAGGVAGYIQCDTSITSQSLALQYCSVSGSVAGGERVGGVVGQVRAHSGGPATIENCDFVGSVVGTQYVGGVAGLISGFTSGFVTVENCDVSGEISGTQNVGGVVGLVEVTGTNSSNSVTVESCTVNADVIGTFNNTGGVVGAIEGRADMTNVLTVKNCNAAGKIMNKGAEDNRNMNIGGVVGKLNYADVQDCYTTCSIITEHSEYVGGVVGSAANSTVLNCYATGDVSGVRSVGGVAGFFASDSIMKSCYSTGDVSGTLENIGGVAGEVNNAEPYGSGAVENCYANGNITGGSDVGGVAGFVSGAGKVKNCYATGSVTGSTRVGGVAGTVRGSTASIDSNSGSVEYCVALNPSVSATGSTSILLGYVYGGEFDGLYYFSGVVGTADGRGTAMTAADIFNANFWTNTANWKGSAWDADTWAFEEGKLPTLKSIESDQVTYMPHIEDVEVPPPPYRSSRGSTSVIQRAAPVTYWIEAPEAAGMAKTAREKALAYALSRNSGSAGIRANAAVALAGFEYRHDTLYSSAVQVRVYIPKPEQVKKDLLLSGYVSGSDVDKTKALFEKWFDNKLCVVHFEQQGEWGQTVSVAAKVDLSGMDITKLVIYAYDRSTNSYKLIKNSLYRVDSNGYLHFTTVHAGDIIICEKPLVKK